MDRVRLAVSGADISHVVSCIKKLVAAIDGPLSVDQAQAGASVARLIRSDAGVVFVSSGGFIAGEIMQTLISPKRVAFEHGWFADDKSGVLLLEAFEGWAYEQGAELVKISAASGAARGLRARGYRLAEQAWVK